VSSPQYVVERILEHREAGIDLKRQAVLFRAAHHSAALEVELALVLMFLFWASG
jgi:DNA helicase-2/ATP-dependent DNA helicase PcrA